MICCFRELRRRWADPRSISAVFSHVSLPFLYDFSHCSALAPQSQTRSALPLVQPIYGSCRPTKGQPNKTLSGLAFSTHWCIIPHPAKAAKGGEVRHALCISF